MIIHSLAVQAAIRRRSEREGLLIHTASYGGSGTVFFTEWLEDKLISGKHCLTPGWHALLNHYALPIDLGLPRVVLMADPVMAYQSVRRRGIAENVTRHLHGGQYGQDQISGMIEFFDRWTVTRPLVFCKYEAIYDHLDDLAECIDIDFANFPKRRERRTQEDKQVDTRLLDLRERFNALPDFFSSKATQSQQCFQPETLVSSGP